MKKYILSFLFLTSSFLMFAQAAPDRCPDKNASAPDTKYSRGVRDFTITDTDGNVLNLYDHLDSGYTIFVDLFFTNCSWCAYYAPIIEQIYENTGAGQENILFWGISRDPVDSDVVINLYKDLQNITNPCAGPEGNGQEAHNAIVEGQNMLGFPTYAIICPDGSIFFDPLYPPTVDGYDTYFEQCALLDVDEQEFQEQQSGIMNIYPNPVINQAFVDVTVSRRGSVELQLYDLLGQQIRNQTELLEKGNHQLRLDLSGLQRGHYIIKLSENGQFRDVKKIVVVQ